MTEKALAESMLLAWRTSERTTAFLVGRIPPALWAAKIPGYPHRTVRSVCAHFHNSRARWIRTLGTEFGIKAPALVNVHRVTRRELLPALKKSAAGIAALLKLGLANGGQVPAAKAYTWRNLPLDVGHVLAYFVAHEGHHRGQLLMVARMLGERLPRETVDGVWQWSRLLKAQT